MIGKASMTSGDVVQQRRPAPDDAWWSMAVLGLDGTIRRVSPGLCALADLSEAELVGQPFTLAVGQGLAPDATVIQELLHGATRTTRHLAATELTSGRRWVGEVAATVAASLDGERELHLHLFEGGRRINEHLVTPPAPGGVALSIDQMRIGIAIVGLDGHAHAVNQAMCEITGYDAGVLTSGLDLRELTHPDDVDQDMRLAMSLVSGDLDTYVVEKRLVRPDGEVVWVRQEVTVDRDLPTGTLRFIAQIIDITERKQVEVELAASRASYVNLIDRMPIGIVSCDADGRIITSNDAAATIAGRREFPPGFRIQDVMHPHDLVALLPTVIEHIRSGLDFHVEFRVLRPDGTERWVRNDVHPNHAEDGTFTGLTGTWFDISEIRAAENVLRQQAVEDQLTGLGNRRFLFDALEQDVAAGQAGGTVPTVLFVDLDGFKAINDDGGHAIGDLVLIEVASRIRDTLGPADLAARIGGDEFAVCCAPSGGGSTARAELLADALIASLADPIVVDGRVVRVGASVGIADWRPGLAADDLVREADRAVYRAKREGRGCWRRA